MERKKLAYKYGVALGIRECFRLEATSIERKNRDRDLGANEAISIDQRGWEAKTGRELMEKFFIGESLLEMKREREREHKEELKKA